MHNVARIKIHILPYYLHFPLVIEASLGAEAQSVTVKSIWLWVRSPLEEMKHLFSFLRSGVDAMPPIFGYSRNRRKVRNEVS